ncbi:MAG TPA: hypothetical protein VHO70_09720 [Chitinispirillaceae bacterium]|nr:hypothetical protein [Chitinispirillaceae bacterium]
MKNSNSMGGMIINVDMKLSEVEFSEGDLLILPGADTWMEEEHNSVIEIVGNLVLCIVRESQGTSMN